MIEGITLIKLYFTLNKLMYKHSMLGKQLYSKQKKPRKESKDHLLFIELGMVIDTLLESNTNVVLDEVDYPFFGAITSQELEQLLDRCIYKYELDPVPYIDFPKNSTTYISGDVGLTSDGTVLPEGGGVGFYLTKSLSGSLVWKQITTIQSDFNLL